MSAAAGIILLLVVKGIISWPWFVVLLILNLIDRSIINDLRKSKP